MPTELSDFAPARPVEQIMQWRADEIVRRYCADTDRSMEHGMDCFQCFKQFMVVCAGSSTVKAPSEAVDEMWHTALLFTRPYRVFCRQYLGTYIDHEPVEVNADAAIYGETRAVAEAVFGALDERFWPSGEFVSSCGGCASIYVP